MNIAAIAPTRIAITERGIRGLICVNCSIAGDENQFDWQTAVEYADAAHQTMRRIKLMRRRSSLLPSRMAFCALTGANANHYYLRMREALMKIRLILSLMLIAGLSPGTLALRQGNLTSDLLNISDEMIQTTARLRGLEPKAPIQKGVKSREEISRFLNERVQEEYSQGELEKEGRMLRKLGLIPADYELQGIHPQTADRTGRGLLRSGKENILHRFLAAG